MATKGRRKGRWKLAPSEGSESIQVERVMGGWALRAVLAVEQGRLVVSDLEVHPAGAAPPPTGLRMADLKSIRLSEALDAAQDEAWTDQSPLTPEARKRIRSALRGGRGRAWTADENAQFTEDYLNALRRQPTAPIPAMLRVYERLGIEGVTDAQVRSAVKRQRENGWLAPRNPGRGRAQGWPTSKLLHWKSQYVTRMDRKVRKEVEGGKHQASG